MDQEKAERKAELRGLKRLQSVVGRDQEATDDTSAGESLRRLARSGDMEAALLLEEINSPQNRIDDLLLAEAIKFDPHWQKLPDGLYRRRTGGAHKTPEDLVVAFLEAAGDDISKVLSQETREKIAEEMVREEIGKRLEAKVQAGEFCRVLNEDGEIVFQRVSN